MPFPLLEKGRLIPISWVVRVYMYVCVRVGVCGGVCVWWGQEYK